MILDQIKTSLTDYTQTVSIENYPQFQEMENAFVVIFPTLTLAGLIFPAYVTFKRELGHRRGRRWIFIAFTVIEAYLDVRVWQKYATTGMTLSGEPFLTRRWFI